VDFPTHFETTKTYNHMLASIGLEKSF